MNQVICINWNNTHLRRAQGSKAYLHWAEILPEILDFALRFIA